MLHPWLRDYFDPTEDNERLESVHTPDYVPLRSKKRFNSFNENESLDLHGNMLMDEHMDAVEVQEYYEGHVTESDRDFMEVERSAK